MPPTIGDQRHFCRRCGYCIDRLSDARCPECATPYDLRDPKTFHTRRPVRRTRTELFGAYCLAYVLCFLLCFLLPGSVLGLDQFDALWRVSLGLFAGIGLAFVPLALVPREVSGLAFLVSAARDRILGLDVR